LVGAKLYNNYLGSTPHLVSLAVWFRKWKRGYLLGSLIDLIISDSLAERRGRLAGCTMVLHVERGPDVAAAVITMVSTLLPSLATALFRTLMYRDTEV
jgi:hypothetical protein